MANRTVSIPSETDPFVVKINNETYSYPAGTEQSVPDAVADVIDNYWRNQPKDPGVAYDPKYTKKEVDESVDKTKSIIANPALAGTEAALEGLQVGETKYKIPDEITKIYITEAKGNISCNYTYSQLASMLRDKTKTFDIMVNNQAEDRIFPVATYDNGATTISFFILSNYLSTTIRISIYTVTNADAWSLETKTIALT